MRQPGDRCHRLCLSSPPPPLSKKPCSATGRIGGAIEATEAAGDAAIALNLAYLQVASAGMLVGVGCLEPTPFEPLTCAASGFGGVALLGRGVVMGKVAVTEVEEGVVPGIKQAFNCTQ
jgi:hypothetical protein